MRFFHFEGNTRGGALGSGEVTQISIDRLMLFFPGIPCFSKAWTNIHTQVVGHSNPYIHTYPGRRSLQSISREIYGQPKHRQKNEVRFRRKLSKVNLRCLAGLMQACDNGRWHRPWRNGVIAEPLTGSGPGFHSGS